MATMAWAAEQGPGAPGTGGRGRQARRGQAGWAGPGGTRGEQDRDLVPEVRRLLYFCDMELLLTSTAKQVLGNCERMVLATFILLY